jgi:DeoR/GlpR family transcriptional regulator of sugar metabolism
MATFSIDDLAKARGVSYDTMRRHIQEYKNEGKFEKTSKGIYYSEEEAHKLATLFGFDIGNLYKPINPKGGTQGRLGII